MRRRRGFSTVEVMVGLTLLTMTLIAIVSLFITGFRSYYRTSAQVELAQENAQGMRVICERLSEAINVTVSADGRTLTYNLPMRTLTADPVTGEREYSDPLTSDGVNRTFTVNAAGKLTDGTARSFVNRITLIDPDPSSIGYKQVYKPFTLTTVGSTKALTINLITLQKVHGKDQFARMKTTLLLRNLK
jgi:Tfp pilus assembly protein PilV